MAEPRPSTWLITGASSGLGAATAEAALRAGHKVIATARNPSKAKSDYPQIESLGGKWVHLDTASKEAGEQALKAAEEFGGRLDVVVNNAGFSLLGSVEDMSEDEIESQMNTNFYGPIRIIKAFLPMMRKQKSGTIVNVSSIAAVDPLPSCALYSASKAALEAFSESLSHEVAHWNIRVLLVEPGVFRTNFFASFVTPAQGLNSAYKDTTLDNVLTHMRGYHGKTGGDSKKAAKRIVDVVSGTSLTESQLKMIRLPLGRDCYDRATAKLSAVADNLEAFKEITLSTEWDSE